MSVPTRANTTSRHTARFTGNSSVISQASFSSFILQVTIPRPARTAMSFSAISAGSEPGAGQSTGWPEVQRATCIRTILLALLLIIARKGHTMDLRSGTHSTTSRTLITRTSPGMIMTMFLSVGCLGTGPTLSARAIPTVMGCPILSRRQIKRRRQCGWQLLGSWSSFYPG